MFEKFRKEILQARLIMVEGKLQIEGEVIHVVVQQAYDLSRLLRTLTPSAKQNLPALIFEDPDAASISPVQDNRIQGDKKGNEKVFSEARNFK